VRVLRGSGTAGEELAALQFVNGGKKTCQLVGYPNVVLLRSGQQVGQSSQPSSAAPSQRTLPPGGVAQSLLHDFTNCQAPLSDSARITIPGTATTITHPVELRGCVIKVDRLGPPS
jgi:hypothetical protein